MRAILFTALAIAGLVFPAVANQKTSAYTTLDLDRCRTEPPAADDPLQGGVWWCDGYGGIAVRVAEGDLRYFVSYGDNAAAELAASETLPAFNTIHTTLEWRLEYGNDDGAWHPLATILRFFTETGDGQKADPFLVITRLGGPGQVCHVGYVNARLNPDANRLARQIADEASPGFTCGADNPLYYGLSGDDARE
jgi:hypothetical protein